jgi:predicted lactoylglutathione lyase
LPVSAQKRGMGGERIRGYATGKPYDGEAAHPGNGLMVALTAPSREVVDQILAEALASGGRDEGAPGERMPGFYGAYFRDPDGNKLCVFMMG